MYFILYQSGTQWYWTLYAPNHKKIADGAEGYWNQNDARNGIALVQGTNSQTPIIERP
jgi:uncharacterized protein YegP (UPF0339 family)